MFAYAIELRRQLDAAGLSATRIIGPDAFTAASETLCQGMIDNSKLNAAIDAIGVHGAIPGAGSACQQLSKSRHLPMFMSEVGSKYGDTPEAMSFGNAGNAQFLSSSTRSQGDNWWNPFGG